MKYTHLYSDNNGESHFKDSRIVFGQAEQCSILRAKSGWQSDWHPAPFRQLHFYLSGEVEAETSDGETRRIGAGDITLVEDTSGKGHRSRVIGSSDVLIAVVKLASPKR